MWAYESVFYQIYPLGFCGAPFENDGVCVNRISKVIDWIPHLQRLNVNAVYFSPVFESDTHGYNTRDYTRIDSRLGTNKDFKKVCDALHKAGIKVVLDGVFNHVGRGFPQFKDVCERRENSPYRDWFARIAFDGNSPYNDGLWYEGWEGNYDLVKLNLRNEEVISYLLNAVGGWIDEFGIDGIRLDVAYCLDREFLRRLREFCDSKKDDFFLLGEVLHGEYGRMLNEMHIHSLTNYQCYKGLYSAFNSSNMFEIIHSLLRLFGPEDWTVARGAHLLSFADNHDVPRIATILNDKNQLKALYALLFGMPGIPIVYYGSEWGIEGSKNADDTELRPCLSRPEWNDLSDYIAILADIKKGSNALNYGGFISLHLTNLACVFKREAEGECILVAVNMDANDFFAGFNFGNTKATDLLTGEEITIDGGVNIPGYGARILKLQ